MKILYMSLPGGLTACIESDSEFFYGPETVLLLQAYVPGVEIISQVPEQVDIQIQHSESEKFHLEDQGVALHLSSPWKGRIDLEVFLMLYAMLRRKLLLGKLYTIHGACIQKNDPLLIIGHSASGKTSILLKLVEKYNYQVFSGNKTVVSFSAAGLLPIAGTKTITVKKADQGLSAAIPSGGFPYWDRYAFQLPAKAYFAGQALPVRTIVLTRIDDRRSSCRRIEPITAVHKLYTYFLDVINADVVFGNGKGLVSSETTRESKQYLVDALRVALADIAVYDYVGTADSMADAIAAL